MSKTENYYSWVKLFGGEPMPNLPGVYQIMNTHTGDFYIGGSINLFLRRRAHLHDLGNQRGVPLLQKSFNAYPPEAFEIRVLEVTDTPAVRERWYLREMNPPLNVLYADHPFDVNSAAAAVGCHPNKFSDWWYRTERKLLALAAEQPEQFAAAFELIRAEAMECEPETSGELTAAAK